MLTLSIAARALASAQDAAGLAAVARVCGFAGDPAPLDAKSRAALGLPSIVRSATVMAGRGVLRALCVEVQTGTLTREAAALLALRVQRRSPFALWLTLATERRGDSLSIATAALAPRPRTSLLLVSRGRVLDSDAETLRALAGASDGLDVLVHARWCEVLGRDALTQRFFRALETTVDGLGASIARDVPAADARALALLTTTRLLFLAFLEAKGWLDGDHGFLRRLWDSCTGTHGGFHRRVLQPLCFGTLNTPPRRRATVARAFGRVPFLNGGLFTRTPLERRFSRAFFPDATLGALVSDLLGKWRFTVREQTTTQAEAAVDPEMLGRAFESLMASRERRTSGTFYTPRSLVARVLEGAFDAVCDAPALRASLAAIRAGDPLDASSAAAFAAHIASLRVVDPACGSGAFLVHALHELATLRAACGDVHSPGALHRDILARQIFGVDREPTAVWLCELRLWLAVVVETDASDPRAVPPLPNLDAHVRVGDALAGDAFTSRPTLASAAPLARLRERYARASGARKRTLARALSRAERSAATAALDLRLSALSARRRDLVLTLRGRDLFGARIRPVAAARVLLDELRRESRALRAERQVVMRGGAVAFDFAAQFADVGLRGGFDVVIGNPPWVRLHRIPPNERARLRAQFRVYREAGWTSGAAIAGVSAGFAAQVDLAALFIERALTVARDGGTLALLVPAKLWRSLAGGGVRSLLLRQTRLRELEDWSEARATFDAAVYPSLVVATRGAAPEAQLKVAEHHRDQALRWEQPQADIAIDATPGAPWLWLPSEPRVAFDLLRARGVPLGERTVLRPRLGVKCGCNEAFVVRRDGREVVARDGRRGTIEPSLLRPLVRGDGVVAWRLPAPSEHIVFPHDSALRPLTGLPPLARRWLLRWRVRLTGRSDQKGSAPWWSLYRLDGARSTNARVVWADMSRTPRAAVIQPGDPTVPLNSCYVVLPPSLDDAHALVAWLNSPLAAAWLAALAEPARGGFRRLLGWTMALLPLPRDWDRAIEVLAPLGARGVAGTPPERAELLDAALEAFGIPHKRVEALLTWGHR